MTIDDATIVRLRELCADYAELLALAPPGAPRAWLNNVLRSQKEIAEAARTALPALLKEREKFRARIRELGDGNVERDSAQCDTIARLQSELDAARTAIERLQDALRWCSGSADFNEGGRAYAGWQKVCAPLLEPQREDAP